ncbi:MAG: DUF222 domain-containing protein, partial [Frankiales bacterium]|nr:DUF222 domain-containing protein [Frankiales bacterium]
MKDLSSMSVTDLADGICTWAGRIAAGEARLLALIAEFDRREAWAGPGLLSCAHWLSWRIGLAPGPARERVRVARRLDELPAVRAAFEVGRMTWSQVRAITRVAEPDDGVDWVDLANHTSGAQIERIVRGIRRVKAVEEAAADPELAEYRMRTRHRYDADGNLVVTIYARAQDAPVILAGLEAQRAELDRRRLAVCVDQEDKPVVVPVRLPAPPTPVQDVPAGTSSPGWAAFPDATQQEVQTALDRYHGFVMSLREDGGAVSEPAPLTVISVPAGTPELPTSDADAAGPRRSTDGEALLAMANTALDAERAGHPEAFRRNRSRLVVQVDPLSGWGRLRDGELLPPTSLRAALKTLPGRGGTVRLRPLRAADRTTHDAGRTARAPSLALRELLGSLDGERCRFPGCTRHRKLHAHHVVYWSDGGRTDLSNLVLVCSRHHTLVHQLGFQLVLHPDRRLDVHTADDVSVLHHPVKPWGNPAE